MSHQILNEKPTEWLLVKVPRITDGASGADATARFLRESVREHHFGGEVAAVRRLTEAEVEAIQSVKKPAYTSATKALIVAALEHSTPLMSHYPEPRERHAQALAAARALV